MNRAIKKIPNYVLTTGLLAAALGGIASFNAPLYAQDTLLAPELMEELPPIPENTPRNAPELLDTVPEAIETAAHSAEQKKQTLQTADENPPANQEAIPATGNDLEIPEISSATALDSPVLDSPVSSSPAQPAPTLDSPALDSPGAPARITPEMMERFERLEAETRQLRAEVARLNKEKSMVQPSAARSAVSPSASAVPAPSVLSDSETPSAPQTPSVGVSDARSQKEVMTRQEVNEYIEKHIKDNAWRVGPMKITPYGRIWASMLVTSSRMQAGDILSTVLPNDSYGQTSFNVQARTSRLGLNIAGPDLCCGSIKSSGVVEVDFINQTNSENKGALQLREAYWQLSNDDFKFLFGQTKDVILPLYSNMFDYNALYALGNPGYRNPMASFTRYYYPDQNVRMEVTTALSMVCGGDFSAYDAPGAYPTIQSRIGWTIARPNVKTPIQFGFSGHVGEQRYNFPGKTSSVDSWSANFDLVYPITDRLSVRGEFFHGQSMAGFFGGAFQNIDYDPTTKTGTRKSIHTTGGWGEIVWKITDKLQYAVGLGIDDPHNSDMEAAPIEKNGMYYTNFVYDFTNYFRSGIMYAYVMTDYRDGNPGGEKGRAHAFEWMWQINF